ncbi:uncharacterized protein LOC17882988 [Capsella rubella]|uniref:uncharacterized protein LOC17882988 n=1 Tax=Capsella rubella TaxID=81985 RepID=UPI000CD57FCB|nr:uncharacterized protein LOC17882988 [Capsella rubella]
MGTESETTTISVEGYDTRLRVYSLKLALTKHFSSCGKVGYVYVPRDRKRGILKSVSFLWIEGEEDVEEKALKLSGTDVGGWTAIVKPAPMQKECRDPWSAAVLMKIETHRVRVTGYDTSLPEIDTQIALCEHFSSCGEVTRVVVLPCGAAFIYLQGERCEVKALKLSGSNMGGMNLFVGPIHGGPEKVRIQRRRRCNPSGYTPPSVLLDTAEHKKRKMEMDMEMEMDEMKKKKMKMELKKIDKDIKKHMKTMVKMDMDMKKSMEMEDEEMALS